MYDSSVKTLHGLSLLELVFTAKVNLVTIIVSVPLELRWHKSRTFQNNAELNGVILLAAKSDWIETD